MFKLAVIVALVACAYAQDGAYEPKEGEEYDPEHKAAPVEHAAPAPKVVKHVETVVVKEVHARPAHHTIGSEARRVNYINGQRQHYVNVKAVEHGASAGTAPEYGVPGTGVNEYHDGDYYNGGHYDNGYGYGRESYGYNSGYNGGYGGGYNRGYRRGGY